jgi:copper chaperone CopZ
VRLDWVTCTLELLLPLPAVTDAQPAAATLLQQHGFAPRPAAAVPAAGGSTSSCCAAAAGSPQQPQRAALPPPSPTRLLLQQQVCGTGRAGSMGFEELIAASGAATPAALLGRLLEHPPPASAGSSSSSRGAQQQPAAAVSPARAAVPATAQPQPRLQPAAPPPAPPAAAAAPVSKATYRVSGISCGSCVAAIQNGLKQERGVLTAAADVFGNLTVTFDSSLTDAPAVAAAVTDIGYPAELLRVQAAGGSASAAAAAAAGTGGGGVQVAESKTVRLSVQGMSCASCVSAVERVVSKVCVCVCVCVGGGVLWHARLPARAQHAALTHCASHSRGCRPDLLTPLPLPAAAARRCLACTACLSTC